MTALRKTPCPHPRRRSVRDPCGACLGRRRARSAAGRLLWREPPCAHLPAPARRTRARRRPCLLGRAPGPTGRHVRLWHVSAGGMPALVLGPLAVDPSCRELGIGAALMSHALAAAKARGHGAVILLGDAPYYARFGFSRAQDRRAVAARPVRARPPARPRTARGRARRRRGHDRAVRRGGAERKAAAGRKAEAGRSRRLI